MHPKVARRRNEVRKQGLTATQRRKMDAAERRLKAKRAKKGKGAK